MNYDKNIWSEAGSGMEAYVLEGHPAEIEGIGGPLLNSIHVAKRINWGDSNLPNQGLDIFYKQVYAKLLEISFIKNERYKEEHVPNPLGHFQGGYYYKYVEGCEGYPLTIYEDGRQVPVIVKEWNDFLNAFNIFGFSMGDDTSENDGGQCSKNVVSLDWDINDIYDTGEMHPYWRRIDFGSRSLQFLPEKALEGLKEKKGELRGLLGDYYDLAVLCVKAYPGSESLPEPEQKVLEDLTFQFRKEMIGL